MTTPTPDPAALAATVRSCAAVEAAKRGRLIDFVRMTQGEEYAAGWVHADICRRLERFSRRVREGKSPRLILCMPPRHGKSTLVSQVWPLAHLGQHPRAQIVCASYGQDLADENSRRARTVAGHPDTRQVYPALAPDASNRPPEGDAEVVDQVRYWQTGQRGSYQAVGVGGGLTGRGADILIIDDPVKDRVEAESKATRDKVWSWYTSTAYTRLSPGGGVVVMCTRWHEDDLVGRLLAAEKDGGDRWEVVVYPAIATEDEAFRKAGEALDPERWPVRRLRQIERAIGSYDFAALYQQNPRPSGGSIIQRAWTLQRYDLDPRALDLDEQWLSLDCTFKDKATSDFVVMQAWGRKARRFYLLDQVRARLDFVATSRQFRDFSARWPHALRKLVEDKANGPAILSALQREIDGLIAWSPDAYGSKPARLRAVSPLWESGQVWLPSARVAPWVHEFVEELTTFPAASHDDQVDACSMALLDQISRGPSAAERLLAATRRTKALGG